MNNYDKMATTIPPHSEAVEKAVIGCTLIDNALAPKLLKLPTEIFFVENSRKVLELIRHSVTADKPFDILTLAQSAPDLSPFIVACAKTGTTATFEINIATLRELFLQREIQRLGIDLSFNVGDSEEKIKKLSEALEKIQQTAPEEVKTRREKLESVIDELHELKKRGQDMNFGIPTLDMNVHGLRRKRLYVIGGGSSSGKSGLGLCIARRVAFNDHKRVLFFSLELSYFDCVGRVASSLLGIPSWKIQKPQFLTADELQKFQSILFLLENSTLEIVPNTEVDNISDIMRRVKDYKPDLVILDHIQELPDMDENKSRFDKTFETLGRVLKRFRDDAEAKNYAFAVLSQISREHTESKKNPAMNWFQGSSKIEQRADAAMIIHSEDPAIKNLPKLWLVKMRNGTAGVGQPIPLAFHEETLDYSELYSDEPVEAAPSAPKKETDEAPF